MQVTETLNDGLKRGYKMILSAKELDQKVNEKLKEAQPDIELKGFRKGKVPLPLLKKQFGQRVLGEAMQEAVDGAMSRHFEEKGERPAFEPDVKMTNPAWKEGDDVEIELTYEALPKIPEMDFKAIKVERLQAKADEAGINAALTSLAKNAQSFEDKKAGSKAKEGDQVVIDFVGRVDGEAFEGGSADDFPLVLGSGSFIPGFEDQLIGAKAGEDIAVTVTFPEAYQAQNLAGKEAVFDCKIKAVRKPVAAEINDELATKFGAEDLDALKRQVAERLEQEYADGARAVLKRHLLDQLDELLSFDLPPSMVEAEAGQIAHQLWHEENPDDHGHDHPEIEVSDEHRKLAVRRVRLGLLLADLGQKAKVEVTDAELTQAVMKQARQYPGQERQFFEFVQKNPEMRQQLRAPIFEDKVIDHLLGLVDLSEKQVTKDELEAVIDTLNNE